MKRLLFLFLLSFQLLGAQAPELTNSMVVEILSEFDLPAAAEFKGEFLTAAGWEDAGGENFFIVSEIVHEAEMKNELYVYQYTRKAGQVELVWDIRDYSISLCSVEIVPQSLQVIDLNGDETMETAFIYHFPCDGLDPTQVKLMLHVNGEKLAFRGQVPVEEDMGEYKKTPDPVVANYPAYFQNFMDDLWEGYIMNLEVEYAREMVIVSENFRLMSKEYLFASGGVYFVPQDGQGRKTNLPQDLQNSIAYAEDLKVEEDKKWLWYASLQGVGIYDYDKDKHHRLVTLFEGAEAVSSLSFSPSGRKVAFIVLNQDKYAESTRIFILTLDGTEILNKQKIDESVFRMAASDWILSEVKFISETEIEIEVLEDVETMEPVAKRLRIE